MVDASQITGTDDDENAAENGCVFGRRRVKRIVSILAAPRVEFISLVGHAANGLPFRVIKGDEGTQTQGHSTMKNTIPLFGQEGAQLNRLEFPLATYKTEADVAAYLKKYDIRLSIDRMVKNDTHYVIPAVHEDSLEAVTKMDDNEGVSYWIGRLKAPLASIKPAAPLDPTRTIDPAAVQVTGTEDIAGQVAKGDNTVTTAKGEVLPKPRSREEDELHTVCKSDILKLNPTLEVAVKKTDTYLAGRLRTQTLQETLETGGLEIPGLYAIFDAIRTTVDNVAAVGGNVPAAIRQIFADGGEIVAQMASVFFPEGVAKSDETKAALDGLMTKFRAIVSSSKPAEGEVVVTKSDEGAAAPLTRSEVESVFANLLGEKLAPVLEALKKGDTLERRLVDLEGVRTVRKSLETDPDVTPTTVAKGDDEAKLRRIKKEEEEDRLDREFMQKQFKDRIA